MSDAPKSTVFAITYTPEQATQLTNELLNHAMAMAGGPGHHDLALTALLSAYATVADGHPCCTRLCARVLVRLSEHLNNVADSRDATKH